MKLFLSSILIVFLFTSCIKNNPDPAWLEVTEWTLIDNPNNPLVAGELSHNITDAWVYIDDKVVGVFEVPFKIPILESGPREIKLYPTIWDNGISATKRIYPFMEPYVITAELVQNETLKIDPVTQYYSVVNFEIVDFEGFSTGFTDNSAYPASITTSSDPTVLGPFNGSKFGRVDLNSTSNEWKSIISQPFNLPQSGAEVYMELDYYNNASISTGVLSYQGTEPTTHPNIRINPQEVGEEKWKKIYIELKTIVSGTPNADSYYMTFSATWPDSIPNAQINLDNIKLVY